MFEIRGKVALVTGGASGIGLATIEQLLQEGLKGVTIADVNEELGESVVEELKKKYGDEKVLFVKTNVADRHEFEDAFKKTISAFRNLDVVINAAGILNEVRWEEEIAVNLGGTMSGTYFAFEKYLPKHKSGSEGVIVNLSSITGVDVFDYSPFYSATKSGVNQLSRAYGTQAQYNRYQIRVIAVCPGMTDTPMRKRHSNMFLNAEFVKLKPNSKFTVQPAHHVAQAIVQVITTGRSGSVWLVNNNEAPYELKFSTSKDKVEIL